MKNILATSCFFLLANAAFAQQERVTSVEGATLFKSYCAVCHGLDAKGGGPMASALKSKMPDLTKLAASKRGKFPLADVQQIISGEKESRKGHGTQLMPVWGPVFSQVDNDRDMGRVRILNLAQYIESLQAK
jgi:mono/diheme cytochrome c family protein